jgi:hypothetical protein
MFAVVVNSFDQHFYCIVEVRAVIVEKDHVEMAQILAQLHGEF